jgi:hypothetical protein
MNSTSTLGRQIVDEDPSLSELHLLNGFDSQLEVFIDRTNMVVNPQLAGSAIIISPKNNPGSNKAGIVKHSQLKPLSTTGSNLLDELVVVSSKREGVNNKAGS